MKLYDCSLYYDEDLILNARLNILNKYFDKFIICESKYSHSGRKKKLNFNINNFSEFKDKIIYVVNDKEPDGLIYRLDKEKKIEKPEDYRHNAIKRIASQRNTLMNAVNNVADPNDFIFYSDNDEIPNMENFDQIKDTTKKTGLNEAVRVVVGNINNIKTLLCIMDFTFIGGSMGSAVGEKISKGIDKARNDKLPLVIITSSGGARMQEGAYSLMQLAKTSSKLALLSEKKGLYVTVLTDPTTGGITASFAMLGDIILAEPNALIGFAGARVIKQTIGEDLPEGFQRAEFLLEKGFVDHIVNRNKLKETLYNLYITFGYTESNVNEYE